MNNFSFLLVVPVVGVRPSMDSMDRDLRQGTIALASVVVTGIVSSMISLVGIEPVAIAGIARVVVLVSISSSK